MHTNPFVTMSAPLAKRQKRTWQFPDEIWQRIQSLVPRDRDCSSPVAAIFNNQTVIFRFGEPHYCPIRLYRACPGCEGSISVFFHREWDGVLDRPPCLYCPPMYAYHPLAGAFSTLSQTAFAQAMILRRVWVDVRRRVQDELCESDTSE